MEDGSDILQVEGVGDFSPSVTGVFMRPDESFLFVGNQEEEAGDASVLFCLPVDGSNGKLGSVWFGNVSVDYIPDTSCA